jgi:hypothetical protein
MGGNQKTGLQIYTYAVYTFTDHPTTTQKRIIILIFGIIHPCIIIFFQDFRAREGIDIWFAPPWQR